ncbi:MAG: chloramphenicol acetyltransferase [Candidatus Marinimicrobia bacterium]|nr:chloramphenicol acetyltransferase [Candidatus Neomarinimicrobiota bacterium]
MIREINLETWPRRRQFEFFKNYDYPHFNISTSIDISEAFHYTKAHNISLFKTILFVSMKTINNIPEFRCRIREGSVVKHAIIHPSFTVSIEDDQFSFCNADFDKNIHQFFENAAHAIQTVKENPFIQSDSAQDNRVYITCIPWVSFTGVMHPINMHPVDSAPRLAWGKYIYEGDSVKLPYSLQAHHALADGFHAGQFFNRFREIIRSPETLFS